MRQSDSFERRMTETNLPSGQYRHSRL